MTIKLRSSVLLALACALAACGGEKSSTSAASGNNEVLKGTISDEMIPYDTLRSQPPAAKIETSATDTPGGGATRARANSEATESAAQDSAAANEGGNSREQNGAAGSANEGN